MQMLALFGLLGVANAACPYMTGDTSALERRDSGDATSDTEEFLSQFYLNDQDVFMTSDVGGPIEDQNSLSAGERGPTLLEDFIFRQKIQRFDHERVCSSESTSPYPRSRFIDAMSSRSPNVPFTPVAPVPTESSHPTATGPTSPQPPSSPPRARKPPMFVRISTVAGSRGSADTARDVHGFATRFYTDEGNFDIVGNNIPVFFIQDAILFPDLIHAVKPRGDNEIPQAATAHDSAWDFFSQQPSSLHTLMWAMAGHGIPRSVRHVDGFGVHTYRFVTNNGTSKLVKFHWKTLQGKASLVWEEAQQTAGKNADFLRQDLFDSIEAGRFPEWELGVQIMEEDDQLRFGFDLLDPTKIVPEELVPITPIGKMQLNRNPRNYFAETEQVMFQPGPNFEQLPINRPRVPIHNNNRDGSGQMFIPLNKDAYTPNTGNAGSPKQANQTVGNGFFTTPSRSTSGRLVRSVSSTFADAWSQPRLFWNSLVPAEQQFVVDAMRFENSNVVSQVVRENVIIQLNRISNDLAKRVAEAIGVDAPSPDPTYYHDNTTAHIGAFGQKLLKLDGLKVGILASVSNTSSIAYGSQLQSLLSSAGVDVVVVGERMANGVNQTYSASDATNFDAVVIADGAQGLFGSSSEGQTVLSAAKISTKREGVYVANSVGGGFGDDLKEGLRTFKFLDRFALDA
ncbi:Catalase B [Penicillium maclennaniae]|uniref:Catalase B n=1 Tax=Penicillium maclennaniae TaxID=1343394 RepID=UPI00254141B3|nr:Catalase B [Penicillium maclennaniae]KAJ5667852.1 Catalase B [Penicillium maclennaniae]